MPVQNKHFLPIDYLNQNLLIKLARDSIYCYLATRREASADATQFPPPLQQDAASFVTIYVKGKLRGCIGTTHAHRPLVSDVIHNAHSAAFEDPRHSPLKREEMVDLSLEIAVLTTPQPISFTCEKDLLKQLKPDEDGLIIQEGVHRASAIPSQWCNFSSKEAFLQHLKVRAGLSADHWSDRIEAWRFSTITFTE